MIFSRRFGTESGVVRTIIPKVLKYFEINLTIWTESDSSYLFLWNPVPSVI